MDEKTKLYEKIEFLGEGQVSFASKYALQICGDYWYDCRANRNPYSYLLEFLLEIRMACKDVDPICINCLVPWFLRHKIERPMIRVQFGNIVRLSK